MNEEEPRPRGRMKVFFVEMDDHDRERVLWGIADFVDIQEEREEYDIMSSYELYPTKIFGATRSVTMNAKFVAQEDGTIFRLEDFNARD